VGLFVGFLGWFTARTATASEALQLSWNCGGQGSASRSLAFSLAGDVVAGLGQDGKIRLYNFSNSQLFGQIVPGAVSARETALSSNGRLLALAGPALDDSDEGLIELWFTQELRPVRTYSWEKGTINAVAFSPTGEVAAVAGVQALQKSQKTPISSSVDKKVRVWDVQGERLLKILSGPAGRVTKIQFSPDNATLAAGYEVFPGSRDPGAISLWRVKEGTLSNIVAAGFSNSDFFFSPNGQIIITTGWRVGEGLPPGLYPVNILRVWDLTSGNLRREINCGNGDILAGTFLGKEKFVCVQSMRPTLAHGSQSVLQACYLGVHASTKNLASSCDCGAAAIFLPSAKALISGCADGSIGLWRLADGALIKKVPAHKAPVTHLSCSRNGRLLASADLEGSVKVWNLGKAGMSEAWELPTRLEGLSTQLALSPQGTILALSTGLEGGTICLWGLETRTVIYTDKTPTSGTKELGFSPNGGFLVALGWEGEVVVWRLREGSPAKINEIGWPDDRVASFAFSSDGELLALGFESGAVSVWRLPPLK
jgi:WD40 repeat protein